MTGCVNITSRTLRKLATHCPQLKLLRLGVQQVEEVRQRKGGGRGGGVTVGVQQVQEARHMEGGQGLTPMATLRLWPACTMAIVWPDRF